MQPESQTLQILYTSDVNAARNSARTMAEAIGFDATAGEQIALAVSELASNLVKHAKDGTLLLLPVTEGERVGIQVESRDNGPGIRDVDQAVVDGFSTVGSLGYGLGAVNRLMDEFEITSQSSSPGGTSIICKRFVRMQTARSVPGPLAFGAASRPHPLMEVNGDTFVIKQWDASALIGIIDGLGHGQHALTASLAARQYVETHYDQPLDSIFRGTDLACRSTRGVVMALARFDWNANSPNITLTFASVGNVEVRVIDKHESMNFVVRRGILGVNAPNPVVTEHRWNLGSTMILYSDGISSNWSGLEFPDVAKVSAQSTAQRLLRHLARNEDDATVLVVHTMTPEGD